MPRSKYLFIHVCETSGGLNTEISSDDEDEAIEKLNDYCTLENGMEYLYTIKVTDGEVIKIADWSKHLR